MHKSTVHWVNKRFRSDCTYFNPEMLLNFCITTLNAHTASRIVGGCRLHGQSCTQQWLRHVHALSMQPSLLTTDCSHSVVKYNCPRGLAALSWLVKASSQESSYVEYVDGQGFIG